MGNRNIQQKILKMKRRNRYATLSGATSKAKDRVGPMPFEEDEQGKTKTLPAVRVLVGHISLSKQVINTGRGPDAERMQEYYQRVHSYDQALPQTLGLTEPMKELMKKYDEVLKETPREYHVNYVNNHTGRLDLYFNLTQFFFVDVDYKTKIIRRSRIYASKRQADLCLELDKITWVEYLPKQ